ncbi:hypothetical protein PBCVAN69C_571R [Paramecium bursaria Chlorella virus AN69C]|uniref:Uncharacterized protein n=1 Tax=Paramecium bursaria Chlorella virus IL3A TaxID=46019 RepID=M1H5J1_PBCVI|nr:hypothetical protein PBCVAN69C_571R [Paramecium bursaria Chlorella virus AN69C]AGE53993.1 hypothetical protein PBCVIL3A_597L [Paramecium bursaria Chlorella virus IL3A]
MKLNMINPCISDILLYDKTRHVLENLVFEDLAPNETLKLFVRGMIDNKCSYILYSNPFRVICSERIQGSETSSVLRNIDELETKLKRLPELFRITKITLRKYTTTSQECRSSRGINKFLDTIPDDYTHVFIDVKYDAGYTTKAEIHKHEKYYTVFETSILNDDPEEFLDPIVEFYKSVKTHKISMGHIKRTMSTICPFMWSLTSITTVKKNVLFNAEEYNLYRISQDCPKMKFHDELLEISWNPDRLVMCIGEDEYKDISERWCI